MKNKISSRQDLVISAKDIQEIFNKYGTKIDIETSEKILSFLVEFANISLDQIFPDDS